MNPYRIPWAPPAQKKRPPEPPDDSGAMFVFLVLLVWALAMVTCWGGAS